jgi:hypothetical protein
MGLGELAKVIQTLFKLYSNFYRLKKQTDIAFGSK